MATKTKIPPEVEKFASEHNISAHMSDRKYYGKYRYRLTIEYSLLRIGADISNLRDRARDNESCVRHEGRRVRYFSDRVEDLDAAMAWISVGGPESCGATPTQLSFSPDIAKNIRLCKKRLPSDGAYEIQIKDGYELHKCREFIRNYNDQITPNRAARISMSMEKDALLKRIRAGHSPGTARYYRSGCKLKFKDEMILQLFVISYSESVKKIIEYKLVEDVENASA